MGLDASKESQILEGGEAKADSLQEGLTLWLNQWVCTSFLCDERGCRNEERQVMSLALGSAKPNSSIFLVGCTLHKKGGGVALFILAFFFQHFNKKMKYAPPRRWQMALVLLFTN